ncbi:hypothetical protein [Paenibacillus sp. PAMC 26794]|uniref:hypothetical protein n=1 Tax=Paenibacillus sp. PAMC 26794 TaxID=1257080 RepID=UPI0012671507|nr:hypothetical protein [Paenibacillus sp. PAMC 26794]
MPSYQCGARTLLYGSDPVIHITATAHMKIMVGGYPFNIDHELWKTIGADGYAPGADEAVAVAEQLLAQPATCNHLDMVRD